MGHTVLEGEPLEPTHSQMMAIMELKFPMLKHSRATSMKNSSMRVRCFFFTTWRAARLLSTVPTRGHPLPHQPPKGSALGPGRGLPSRELPWALRAVRPGVEGSSQAAGAG